MGVFIARISRGRTIREFVFGVILAPSIVSFVWFSVLGGSAINLQLTGAANISELAAANQPAALFATLQEFPLFWLTAMIAIILVALFFVSGADAASVVMGMLSSKGDLHPKAWTIIVWGVFTGSAAAVCLLAGAIQGSVDAALLALQSVAIASAAPFVLILIGLCFSIMKALRAEQLPTAAPDARLPSLAGRRLANRYRGTTADVGGEPRRAARVARLEKPGSRPTSDHNAGGWLRPSARRIEDETRRRKIWAGRATHFGGSWTT